MVAFTFFSLSTLSLCPSCLHLCTFRIGLILNFSTPKQPRRHDEYFRSEFLSECQASVCREWRRGREVGCKVRLWGAGRYNFSFSETLLLEDCKVLLSDKTTSEIRYLLTLR